MVTTLLFFFKGANNNDIDSSKRPDFAPLAQQCPGERHVRPDQFHTVFDPPLIFGKLCFNFFYNGHV